MRLLYTLRYGSYSGNCGGDLRLFFTTRNAADWQPSPPAPAPGMWIHPPNVPETLTLPFGGSLTFSLYPVTDGIPGLLYLFGEIAVTTATGQKLGSVVGQSSGNFEPNKPRLAILKSHSQAAVGPISYDVGFELAVPWDGTSADCCGQWWALWH